MTNFSKEKFEVNIGQLKTYLAKETTWKTLLTTHSQKWNLKDVNALAGLQSTERRKVYFSADEYDADTFNAELGSTNCMASDAWSCRCLLRIIPWGRFVALRYIGKIWTFLHSAWHEIHEQSLRQLYFNYTHYVLRQTNSLTKTE